jgi:PadR family transcriptional regulator, regulatory protein AphA
MADRALLPGEHAILGLLAREPLHGYDLARLYRAEGLYDVCPVDQSMLYAYLKTLERRGLVEATEERVGRRPPRRLFRLTRAGRVQFERWLQQPVSRMREIRLDFLLKLYFLEHSDPVAAARLVERQIEACEVYLQELGRRTPADPFRALVAESKRTAAHATREWLENYQDRVRS